MNSRPLIFIGLLLLSSIASANTCSTLSGFEAQTLNDITPRKQSFEALHFNTENRLEPQKVQLINLWAVWCPPCLQELPALDSIASNPNYAVETIHIGDNLAAVEQRFSELNIQHLSKTIEPDMGTINRLGFQGLPATLVFVDGQVRYRYAGYIEHSPKQLDQWLSCLSEETKHE